MSAPDDETLRAMLEGLRCGSVHITADRCTGDIRAVEAFCDLVRAAPALAAEVLRLRYAARRYMGASDLLHRARRDGDGDVIAAEADKGDAWVALADLVKYGPYAEGIE